MSNLANLEAAVAAEKTVVESATTLLAGIAKKVSQLDPDQTSIDALAEELHTRTAALSAAVEANTPAITPVPVVPAVVPHTAPTPAVGIPHASPVVPVKH